MPIYFFAVEFKTYFPDESIRSLVRAIPTMLVCLLAIFIYGKADKFVQNTMSATKIGGPH